MTTNDRNAVADSIAERLVRVLAGEDDLHTVVLYGSAATGRLRTGVELESDIDVAVAAAAPLDPGRRLDLAGRIADEFDRPVDLVDLNALHGLIVREILCRGRFLRRDPEFVARKALELYDYETFLEPALREARRARIRRFIAGGRPRAERTPERSR